MSWSAEVTLKLKKRGENMYVAADAEWKVSDHHGWDEGAFVVEPLIFEVENHQRRTVRGQC